MRAAGKILFKILGKLLELTFFPRCGLWSGKDREGRGDLKKRDGTQFLRGGGGGNPTEEGKFRNFWDEWGASAWPPLGETVYAGKILNQKKQMRKLGSSYSIYFSNS